MADKGSRVLLGFVAVVLAGSAFQAGAGSVTLECEGVDYVYESGIGNGPAKRERSARSVSLDLGNMGAELRNGDKAQVADLKKHNRTYKAFFPGEAQVFGVSIQGEEMEIDGAALWLELRYRLEDQRHFLSFTGTCHDRRTE